MTEVKFSGNVTKQLGPENVFITVKESEGVEEVLFAETDEKGDFSVTTVLGTMGEYSAVASVEGSELLEAAKSESVQFTVKKTMRAVYLKVDIL